MFEGYEFSKKWMADHTPDVAIIVYNDHASYFGMEIMPTFAMGIADSFAICDEGYGPRPVPVVEGAPELATHLAASLILDDFDMTVLNVLEVDHGLTSQASQRYFMNLACDWALRVIQGDGNAPAQAGGRGAPSSAARANRLAQASS